MARYTYRPSDLRRTASVIREKVEDMKQQLNKLDEICENLRTSWKDNSASLVYISKVEEKRNQSAQIIAKYEELAGKLENAAARIDANTANITEAGGRL